MIKFFIKYNDSYFVKMGQSPHGLCPYTVSDKNKIEYMSKNECIEAVTQLTKYIYENDLNIGFTVLTSHSKW